MIRAPLHSSSGEAVGEVSLDESYFGVPLNVPLMHQVVTAQLAAARSGTQSTKTRSEVRGGGAKPYRQKGTGNARQGSTRAPHWVGGGIALGPKPRDYRQRTPKKMIAQALRCALSDRASQARVAVVERWEYEVPRTKDALATLLGIGASGRVVVVTEPADVVAARSFANLANVQILEVGELNAYDILRSDWVVFTASGIPGGAKPITKPAETTPPTDSPTEPVEVNA